MQTVSVDGGALFVTEKGVGNPVVFLHAGVADSRMWAEQLDGLSRSHRAIAYDRRGFGKTQSDDCAFSHVDDLLALLDSLGVDRTVLVGCSQGGRVAIDFSLQHPNRVDRLFLCGPAVTGQPNPTTNEDRVNWLNRQIDAAEDDHDFERVNELEAQLWLDGPNSQAGRVSGEIRERFLDMNRIALENDLLTQERLPPDAWSRLKTLRLPTLVAYGLLDLPNVQARCAEVQRRCPNSRLHRFNAAAHLPSMEAPTEFNRVLSDFLSQ